MASGHSRLPFAAHRLLLRSTRTAAGARLWRFAYRAAAVGAAAYLRRSERGAAAYARGSLESEDLMPGLSDIDLAIVLAPDGRRGSAAARPRARWERLRRRVPAVDLLVDHPRFYDDDELREVTGSSASTYGLERPGEVDRGRAAYSGPEASPDVTRSLERPGLYGTTSGWRLLRGTERRPPEIARDAQLRRIACWLELLHWWQFAFPVCVDPDRPRSASLCLKLITEPARIWLWLAHGERAAGRADVLQRALRRMPEEEDALRRALELRDALPDSPQPPLEQVMPVLVRLSGRIAKLIEAQVEDEGATEVRLLGADSPELAQARGGWQPSPALPGPDPGLLPLCDWRALVLPRLPDESFAPLPGDPGDPAAVGAAAVSQDLGPYPVLRAGPVMVFPATARWRTRLRAVQCPSTDPVSFAVADGEAVARFPDVRGWSARDSAVRAVAEHRPWLLTDPEAKAGTDGRGGALGMIFGAARAALFLESFEEGEPELAVTVAGTARRLGARSTAASAVAEEALRGYREFAQRRAGVPPAIVSAMRELVLGLPAHSGTR